MHKLVLRRAVVGLLLLGLVGACTPFALSLLPNDKGRAGLHRIVVSDLAPGEYRFHQIVDPGPSSSPTSRYGWGALLIRHPDGELAVWDVPIGWDEQIGMPDLIWARRALPCDDFRPSTNFPTSLKGVTIECWDDDLPLYWREELRWTLDGVSLGRHSPDMERIDGRIVGDDFLIGG